MKSSEHKFTVERQGEIMQVSFEHLSYEERKQVLENRSESFIFNLLDGMASCLAKAYQQLDNLTD